MRRCLQLAQMGAGSVAPNPMVGALLMYNDRVIGEGYHEQWGRVHAEVNCINNVAEPDRQYISAASLYVSLEPCSHFGKTPPCSELIIKNRIPRVVIGCQDSFAAVNGKGIDQLQHAGIDVTVGVLEKESREMNRRFFIFHQQQRPYIILKWAQSNNGKIARNDASRVLISNELTNRLVHKWRSEEASILVGTHTALQDNPSLTTRLWPGKNPVRMVIDKNMILPPHLNLFDQSSRTIVFNYKEEQEGEMLQYVKLEKEKNIIPQVLLELYEQQLQSVIVEGGAKLLQSFIDDGLWDEARVITNGSMNITDGINAPALKNNILVSEEKIDTDLISFYSNNRRPVNG